MSEIVLHDYWRSSASYRVRIALGLKGLDFRREPVNLLAGAHREPAHRALNPQGLVPVLEIDGLRLTQSLPMLEYLEETRPRPPLLPPDPPCRARLRALACAVAMEIAPICNLSTARHAASLTGGGEAAITAWMQHFIAPGLDAVEALLDHPSTGRFCHGDAPGLGECVLIPQLYNARRYGLDIDRWPGIAAIDRACAPLPAFIAAHPDSVKPA